MCVHIYKFAGAFLQLRNSNVGSVLIQTGVQMTFAVEVHWLFYFWQQHKIINWKYLIIFMQPLSTFLLIKLQKKNLSSFTGISHWRYCRSMTLWAHNVMNLSPRFDLGLSQENIEAEVCVLFCLSQRENLFLLLFSLLEYITTPNPVTFARPMSLD